MKVGESVSNTVAAVEGVPVKPAMDEEGMVMVQLRKSSGKKAGDANNVFIVELIYIELEVLFLSLLSFLILINRINQWKILELLKLNSRN
jgi:hypothetical protein